MPLSTGTGRSGTAFDVCHDEPFNGPLALGWLTQTAEGSMCAGLALRRHESHHHAFTEGGERGTVVAHIGDVLRGTDELRALPNLGTPERSRMTTSFKRQQLRS